MPDSVDDLCGLARQELVAERGWEKWTRHGGWLSAAEFERRRRPVA